jgi:hypothetical protein
MMAALIVLPLFAALGLSLDYAQLSRVRSEIYDAADAAALGAISRGSPALAEAVLLDKDGPLPAGRDDAEKLFNGYLFDQGNVDIVSVDIDVRKTGARLEASVKFEAAVKLSFMGLFGRDTVDVEGVSTAAVPMAPFVDFYLLLDNSPSMGVGAMPADVDKMVANTPDKCAFACHDLSDANNYYNLAKRLGVSMRIDVVRQATQQLTQTAKELRLYDNQYRMGVFTFGASATKQELTQVIAPHHDLDKVRDAASAVDLMTIPKQNYNNDQQTDFDTTFAELDKKIGTVGDGSGNGKREKVVFFVSDGVGDSYKPSRCTKKLTGGRCQEPIDIRVCKSLKDRGVKVAVLYTTYLPLPTNAWYNSWIKPFQAEIPARMSECASPGLFFEVSPSEGISEAMSALFKKVVTNLRLTS